MNLPNKLTVGRLASLPFLVVFLLMDNTPARWLSFVIFVLACITDFLDGRIARSRHLVTVLGKFLDPLADKALICTVLTCFVATGWCHPVALIIVLAREFVVSGVRMAAVQAGRVVAANIWGKLKTGFQMVSLSAVLFIYAVYPAFSWIGLASNIICWIIAVLTAMSGVVYVVDNKDVFAEKGSEK